MRFRNERGQITVLTALCMAVLLGFAALATDIGALFRWKRNLQIVADAAATAAALDYYKNGLGTGSVASAQAAAENAISGNGLSGATYTTTCPVTPSGSAPQACISLPPSSGVHQSNGFVEVQIVQPRPTTFMSYFGFGNLNVLTRAVAGITTGQSCIWVRNNLNVQGNAGLCGVDPLNPGSWTATNNPTCGSGTVCPSGFETACGTYVGGNVTGSGGGGGSNCIASNQVAVAGTVGINLNPSPAVAGAAQQTPPDFLTAAPAAPSSCSSWNQGLSGITTTTGHGNGNPNVVSATLSGSSIAAGCYGLDPLLGTSSLPSGWDATNTVMNLTVTNANLGNGTYIFDLGAAMGGGTLNIASSVCNYGGACSSPIPTNIGDESTHYDGVTLDVYTGNFQVLNTAGTINLYAPDIVGNALNGILLQEPLTNTGTVNIQWGSTNSNFYGYIDTPGATLTMQDQGGGALVTGLYVGNMTLNSELGIMNYNATVGGAPGRNIALVE